MSRSRLVTITTAAGLSLGCGGLLSGEEPLTNPPPPPGPSATLFQQADGSCTLEHNFTCPPPEEGMTCNPPAPEPVECPPLKETVQISRAEDGSCKATGVIDCPEDWGCPTTGSAPIDCPPELGEADIISVNHPYGCEIIDGATRTLTASCPEPLVRPSNPSYRIELNDDGVTCTAFFIGDDGCPEGASCNPPPPADVACPPTMLLPKRTNPPAPG